MMISKLLRKRHCAPRFTVLRRHSNNPNRRLEYADVVVVVIDIQNSCHEGIFGTF
jgi:hypothetical protein